LQPSYYTVVSSDLGITAECRGAAPWARYSPTTVD